MANLLNDNYKLDFVRPVPHCAHAWPREQWAIGPGTVIASVFCEPFRALMDRNINKSGLLGRGEHPRNAKSGAKRLRPYTDSDKYRA